MTRIAISMIALAWTSRTLRNGSRLVEKSGAELHGTDDSRY